VQMNSWRPDRASILPEPITSTLVRSSSALTLHSSGLAAVASNRLLRTPARLTRSSSSNSPLRSSSSRRGRFGTSTDGGAMTTTASSSSTGSAKRHLGTLTPTALRNHVRFNGGKTVLEFFRGLDSDADGFLTREELHVGLRAMGYRDASADEVELIYRWLDHDGSGVIPYRELDQKLREQPIEAHSQLDTTAKSLPSAAKSSSGSGAPLSQSAGAAGASVAGRLRPSPVFLSPTRGSFLQPVARPICVAPGYYDCIITRAPHTLAGSVPHPKQNSATFLRPASEHRSLRAECVQDGRPVVDPLAGDEEEKQRRRRLRRLPKLLAEPERARPPSDEGALSTTNASARLLHKQARELSPSHFAAEIEGTLEHRIARLVVIDATEQVIRHVREKSPERFWTPSQAPPGSIRQACPSTLEFGVMSFK